MYSFFASPFSSELYWIGIATTCLGYAGVAVPFVTNSCREEAALAETDVIANSRRQRLKDLSPGTVRL